MLKERVASIQWARALAMTLAATITLLVSAATPAAAQSHSLQIRNGSRYDIYDVRMSWSGDNNWERDLLGPTRVLSSGTTFTITNITPGLWDVRLEDEGHDVCIIYRIPVYSDKTWDLTSEGLAECEGY